MSVEATISSEKKYIYIYIHEAHQNSPDHSGSSYSDNHNEIWMMFYMELMITALPVIKIKVQQ